jgi:hypothetical protein
MLGKLATKENYLKGFAKVPLVVENFDKQVKEVVEALTILKY